MGVRRASRRMVPARAHLPRSMCTRECCAAQRVRTLIAPQERRQTQGPRRPRSPGQSRGQTGRWTPGTARISSSVAALYRLSLALPATCAWSSRTPPGAALRRLVLRAARATAGAARHLHASLPPRVFTAPATEPGGSGTSAQVPQLQVVLNNTRRNVRVKCAKCALRTWAARAWALRVSSCCARCPAATCERGMRVSAPRSRARRAGCRREDLPCPEGCSSFRRRRRQRRRSARSRPRWWCQSCWRTASLERKAKEGEGRRK